jgi:leucyl-tRNA synthetase
MKVEQSVGKYNHNEIEKRWQKCWESSKIASPDCQDGSKAFYNLMMFPYPSAEGLHVGNMYAFTGSDVFGRYMRHQGYRVFEPIGLDGFGIHSENYALKVDRHPMDHADLTEKNFYKQLRSIGAMFDWTRTVETYKPGYYRWTQWLFTEMFKHGLAYRGKALVNWCPGCKTVLADEQVIDGNCERCGNYVEKRSLEQWFFRITAYAEKLADQIPSLDWSAKVKTAQISWIGKKDGITISYKVYTAEGNEVGEISCYTIHPNTNYGATFVVIAPEHPFINRILEVTNSEVASDISRYVNKAKARSKEERANEGRKKTGVNTGLICVNQLTGYRMLLYVSDFVLMDFGTGAVVGVPAHDERDYDFAREYGVESIQVVSYSDELHAVVNKHSVDPGIRNEAERLGAFFEERTDDYALVVPRTAATRLVALLSKHLISDCDYAQVDGSNRGLVTRKGILTTQDAISDYLKSCGSPQASNIWPLKSTRYPFCYSKSGLMINSGPLDGLKSSEANQRIMDFLERKGWGKRLTTYHLRDWIISRQRYWGPPIPMIFCNTCNKKGVSWFTSKEGKRYQSENKIAKINSEHIEAMSGWFPVPDNQLPVELPRIKDYKPGTDGVAPLAKHSEFYKTTCPECGREARRESDVSDTFLDSAWYFLRYPSLGSPTENKLGFDPEITKQWLPVSMYTGGAEHSVLHLLYSRFVTMALADFGYLGFDEPFTRFFAHGLVIKDGAKMSKSKGNVVNPDEYIRLYGSDALRLYLMFMGPYSLGGDFRDTAMEGMSRWVGKVYRLIWGAAGSTNQSSPRVVRSLHQTVKKVGSDINSRHYNTAIAAMMKFVNTCLEQGQILGEKEAKIFLVILSPFAPHLTEELWFMINKQEINNFQANLSVHSQPWPIADETKLIETEINLAVQVNGKLRGEITLAPNEANNEEKVLQMAKNHEAVARYLVSTTVIRTIFVAGRLVNFVVPKK